MICVIILIICVKIEYLVVNLDDANQRVKLSLRQADILHALAEDEKLLQQGGGVPDLIEGTKTNKSVLFTIAYIRLLICRALEMMRLHLHFTLNLVVLC